MGDSVRKGWFLLDTGAYTSILHSDRLSAFSKIRGELRRMLGRRHHGPTLVVGGHAFTEPNYSVRAYDGDASALGVLGNDVLKRFNLIVDSQRGFVHLKPNGHLGDPFRNPEYYLVRFLALAVVVAGAATVWLIIRRRMRRPDRVGRTGP